MELSGFSKQGRVFISPLPPVGHLPLEGEGHLIRIFRQLILFLIITFFSTCLFAAPPFITDDPGITAYHKFQYYIYGANFRSSNLNLLYLPVAELDYGLTKNTEINLTVGTLTYNPSQGKTETGISDSDVELKYVLVNETKCLPQITFAPSLTIPTGNTNRNLGNGKVWYGFPIWLEKTWNAWMVYGGGGFTINPAKSTKNYAYGGIVVQRQLSEKLALGVEWYLQGATAPRNVPSTSGFTLVDMGATYNVNTSTTLLFSLGHSVSGLSLWYGFLGVNVQT